MAKFPYAFCPTLNKEVLPAEVTDYILRNSQAPLLQCPDYNCRQDRPNTKLVAVCCDPRTPCENKISHFRTAPNNYHSENCGFLEFIENTDYILKHKSEFKEKVKQQNNILLDLKAYKDTSILPDGYTVEFAPQDFMREIRETTVKIESKGADRKTAYRLARCIVPQRTGRLADIVSAAFNLDAKRERALACLTLPGRKTVATYETAFLSVYSLQQHYSTPYIFCGDAKAIKNGDECIVKYNRTTRHYTDEHHELPITMVLNEQNCRKYILKDLLSYAKRDQTFHIYSFSTHSLKEFVFPNGEKTLCVAMEPRAQDSIVIKNRCLNRPRKDRKPQQL